MDPLTFEYRYQVDVEGYSGQSSSFFVDVLPSILNTSYFCAVVLAGTNDLSNFQDPDFKASVIFSNLRKIYEAIVAHGAKLICVTLPLSSFTMKDYVALRSDLNGLIREHCKVENIPLVDLESLIPYEAPECDGTLWTDDLHFNAGGYDKFGDLVFEALKPLLK